MQRLSSNNCVVTSAWILYYTFWKRGWTVCTGWAKWFVRMHVVNSWPSYHKLERVSSPVTKHVANLKPRICWEPHPLTKTWPAWWALKCSSASSPLVNSCTWLVFSCGPSYFSRAFPHVWSMEMFLHCLLTTNFSLTFLFWWCSNKGSSLSIGNSHTITKVDFHSWSF